MRRRNLVIALALVLALAIAVPVIGAPKQQLALHNSKVAKRIAKTAKRKAIKARTEASSAHTSADAAGRTAGAATAELAAREAKTATVAATVSTANEADYVDLGGPQVTVDVPASGLIEVWAQVTIADGAVSLFEDGRQVNGQDPNGVCGGPAGALLTFETTPEFVSSTPGSFGLTGSCASTAAPSPVLFTADPGTHTYSLRYADCGCDPSDSEFSDRTLTVAPRP